MTDVSIPVILGTARPGRESADVAALVLEAIEERGLSTQLIDVADYPISGTEDPDEEARVGKYKELITSADGLVIVVPEYNHGYPGELKLLLDTAYNEYNHKPLGVVSVSSGLVGGARVTEQLQLVALAFEMIPVAPAVHVRTVTDAIDEDGEFEEEGLEGALDAMLEKVTWYASVMAPARRERSAQQSN